MELRKHQSDFRAIVRSISTGQFAGKYIVCRVTPGGGKSTLPLILCRDYAEMRRAKICWLVPRDSLKRQAEAAFVDPYLKRMVGHNSKIRSAQNSDSTELSRYLSGYAATYQSVVANPLVHRLEFEKYKYVLVLDEPHHIPMDPDNPWFKAVSILVERAALVVLASGTMERHDENRIAFIPYIDMPDGKFRLNKNHPNYAWIDYTRTDALQEQAIVPLRFHLFDGFVEEKESGKKSESISKGDPEEALKNLYTMLQSGYANQILDKTVSDWMAHRKDYPHAKLLVVAPNIQIAQKYKKHIATKFKAKTLIATSSDGVKAKKAIESFKFDPDQNILVTVAMAYEGLDVKQVTHVACLTLIRSKSWIEQCVARANRTAPGKTFGAIYAPDDVKFNAIKKMIELGQEELARKKYAQLSLFDRNDYGSSVKNEIEATSGVTSERVYELSQVLTPSDEEHDLRRSIEDHARRAAFRYYKTRNPTEINRQIFRAFGKSRQKMSLHELKQVNRWIFNTYPLNN